MNSRRLMSFTPEPKTTPTMLGYTAALDKESAARQNQAFTSELGHSRRFRDVRVTSAYPPTAAVWDIAGCPTMAGIGFASTNIADVTMVRASRETPAVTAAQTALSDAMTTRGRECKGGVGKYCREREQAVVDRRQALDAAMQAVAQTADPQAVAAVKLVSWVTAGAISPSENDFSMLRLMLLCLLPQLAGVLLMVGRSK
jgi:hypothetical protein